MKPFRCTDMNTDMNRLTRRQFIQSTGAMVASGTLLPTLAIRAQEQDAVPSYLRGYEALFRQNPRAAAIEWHRNAKWGLFVHYALHSLRGLTAADALKAKEKSNAEKKVKP